MQLQQRYTNDTTSLFTMFCHSICCAACATTLSWVYRLKSVHPFLKVFEVTPSLYMVELRKSNGDTLEFHKVHITVKLLQDLTVHTSDWDSANSWCNFLRVSQFYHNISNGLKDVMWKPESSIIAGDEIQHRRSP